MRLRKHLSIGVKKAVSSIVLSVLFGAFKQLSVMDSRMKEEVASWDDGIIYCLKASKSGPTLILQKQGTSIYRLKSAPLSYHDIMIQFKNIDTAFKVLTGQMGLAKAYSAHAFTLQGDIQKTMSFCRCADLAEGYLFPKVMSRRILKVVPKKAPFTLTVYLRILIGFLNGSCRMVPMVSNEKR